MAMVLLGMILRLLPLILNWNHVTIFMENDSWGYHNIGANLALGRGYSQLRQSPYEPDVYRPPGYPVIIAIVYGLVGEIPQAVIVLQIVFSVATIPLTFLAGRLVSDVRTGLWAALLLAIDPLSITYANLLLTEAFSALAVTSIFLLLACYWRDQGLMQLWLGALLMSAAIIVHPVMLLAPALFLVLPICAKSLRTRRALFMSLSACLIAWTPASLWILRNARVADYPDISCVTAVNVLKYKAAGVRAELRGTSREVERDRLVEELERSAAPGASRGDIWQSWKGKGWEVIRNHPIIYAKLHLHGMLIELFGPGRDGLARFLYGSDNVLDESGDVSDELIHRAVTAQSTMALDGVRWGALTIQILVFALQAMGTVLLVVRRRFGALAALWLPAIYVLALSGGPESFCRFRVSYMPLLCIVASFGITGMLSTGTRSRAALCNAFRG
ncbi:MAG TPA: glycosyltransferase family 39 protein [Pirellulales bacterium]